jgi:hypothetical protein
MLFRASNIRSLVTLIIVNILVYTILLRWYFPAHSYSHTDDNIVYLSSISQINQPPSSPTIFKHAPMHDELVGLQDRYIR